MKKSLLLTLASLSLCMTAQADTDYVWTGNANDQTWSNPDNWNVGGSPTAYYPQSGSDNAIIGADAGTIRWEACSYWGATKSIALGSGSTLICNATGEGHADFSVPSITLESGSALQFSSTSTNSDFGLQNDLTVNYNKVTAADHTYFDATEVRQWWGNGHTVYLTGSLDTTGLTGSGTIELCAFTTFHSTPTINYTGFDVTGDSSVELSIYDVTEDGVRTIGVNYNVLTVPEPTTATLSLLALAALCSRRRRKA